MCKKHEKEIHLKTQNTEKKLNKKKEEKKLVMCAIKFPSKTFKGWKGEE